MSDDGVRPVTVVVCAEFHDPRWRWFEPNFDERRLRFLFANCSLGSTAARKAPFNIARFRGAFQAVRLAKRFGAQALVAHGPTPAAWCGLLARIMGLRIPILAHAFNFAALPSSAKTRFFALGLAAVDRFDVFSTVEKGLYARVFDIPLHRINTVMWAVRPPMVEDPENPLVKGSYVCAIGGNARDYETLVAAARTLPDVPFVLVVRPQNLKGLSLPGNVIAYENLPFARTMNILAHSRFMVLPLIDSEVPCGHVTLVAAMHLGKAIVVTDSRGVRDYVRQEENALLISSGSVTELAAATERLWRDPVLADALGDRGREFASRECIEERAVLNFAEWLHSHGLAP